VSEGEAEGRTEAALLRAGLTDMRPAYRRLLVQMKSSDPEAFEEASRRYREELEPAISRGDVDPIMAWLEYGSWLAGQLADGRVLAIDTSGRAQPFDPSSSPEPGTMLLHVPEDDRAPVTLLAVPSTPSEPQRETADLLTG
jgi:hypothetical protein